MPIASKVLWISVLGIGLTSIAGCRDNSPATPRVPPPQAGYDTAQRTYEPNKPMPPAEGDPTMAPRPFDDPPLLIDTPPEAKRFVEVYRQVGRPRLVIFVNRNLGGEVQPGGEGSGELNERLIDFGMMESLLADWMSCDNQVSIMSPATVRRQLTEAQVRDLEAGKPTWSEIGRQLDADVLIQLHARPTKQTPEGTELRLVGDAINLRGGESLARGSVDMLPPLDKPQTNKYTRFMARSGIL